MKRVWVSLMVSLILALGAAGLEAQQTAPAKKPSRKAKKVWTNEDFAERPAPMKGAKAEPASAGKAKPVPEGQEGAKQKEALQELDAQAARAQSDVDWVQSRREELLGEIEALEKQLAAASTQPEQLAIQAQIQEKRKQVLQVDDQLAMDRFKLKEIERKKEEVAPPEVTGDYGVPKPPEKKGEEK